MVLLVNMHRIHQALISFLLVSKIKGRSASSSVQAMGTSCATLFYLCPRGRYGLVRGARKSVGSSVHFRAVLQWALDF